ncbi:MAG: cyclic nucleotide-binding domain-containing protein [Hyphomicrobiaceae bacterium]
MSIQAECAALKKIPMFHDVEMAKLRLFALSGERMAYDAGDVIFRQNEPSEALYVILDGSVDVILESPAGRLRVAQISEGNMFGETGVLCDKSRTATIEAATPVTVIQIDRHTFNEVARDVPQLSLAIARELARRVERMNEQFAAKNNNS